MLLSLLTLPALALADGATIRSGHSGYWYDPARNGEGFVLEILNNDGALLYWFTYDEQGRQRWLTAVGSTVRNDDGEHLDFPTLVVTRGGRFGPDFDPDQVERETVGSASLRFADCDQGEFAFEAFDQTLSMPVQRLTHAMAMPCESRHGVPGRDSAEHAGQTGSWFDPGHNGEGYALQWMNPHAALLTWYSYDTEGEQYWMLGVGQFDGQGRLHFPQLHSTRGARFGIDFDPDDVERFEWGTLTLELGCDAGDAGYTSVLAAFGAGSFDLQRLTRPRGLTCPYQRPKFSDLYEVSYEPIEFPAGTATNPNPIDLLRLADDGSLYGTHRTLLNASDGVSRYELAHLESGSTQWLLLPDSELDTTYPVYVSRDGRRFIRHRVELDESGTPLRLHLERRNELGPWLVLEGVPAEYGVVRANAVSWNFQTIVGGGSYFGVPSTSPAWRYTSALGMQELPRPADTWSYSPVPTAVGDDGSIVLGYLTSPDPQLGWRTRALRWVDGGEAETLFDSHGAELLGGTRACSADCQLIFGSGQAFDDREHPNDRQAWYWRAPGDMAYLGTLKTDLPQDLVGGLYGVAGVNADGSLAMGGYLVRILNDGTGTPGAVRRLQEAMLWTQRTGLVSVGELLAELAIEDARPWTARGAGQITADGTRLLLAGNYFDPQHRIHPRAAILHLQPKSPDW